MTWSTGSLRSGRPSCPRPRWRSPRAAAAGRLREAAAAAERVLDGISYGRIDVLAEPLAMALAAVRDAVHGCATDLRASAKDNQEVVERVAAGRSALAALDELHGAADRILGAFGADIASRPDVVWMDRPPAGEPSSRPPTLRVAPLEVGGLLAERLFSRHTVTLTSATLSLGGSFDPLARQWGLPLGGAAGADGGNAMAGGRQVAVGGRDAAGGQGSAGGRGTAAGGQGSAGGRGTGAGGRDSGGGRGSAADVGADPPGDAAGPHPLIWSGLDVGSPFDHPRSGILYVARHLPP